MLRGGRSKKKPFNKEDYIMENVPHNHPNHVFDPDVCLECFHVEQMLEFEWELTENDHRHDEYLELEA